MTREDMLKAALEGAVMRLDTAAAGSDELATFIALGESLAWLTIIDEALRHRDRPAYEQRREAPGSDGLGIQGLHLARNCITHEALTGLTSVDGAVPQGGAVSGGSAIVIRPSLRPAHVFVTTLTPIRQPRNAYEKKRLAEQQASYRDHVAGREVAQPVGQAARWIVGQL